MLALPFAQSEARPLKSSPSKCHHDRAAVQQRRDAFQRPAPSRRCASTCRRKKTNGKYASHSVVRVSRAPILVTAAARSATRQLNCRTQVSAPMTASMTAPKADNVASHAGASQNYAVRPFPPQQVAYAYARAVAVTHRCQHPRSMVRRTLCRKRAVTSEAIRPACRAPGAPRSWVWCCNRTGPQDKLQPGALVREL